MKTRTTVAITVSAMVLLSAAGAAVVIATGAYNVAATSPHSSPVEWVLDAAMDRSVEAHAGRLTAPAAAANAKGSEGFQNFENFCVICHGAPGVAASEIGKGLYPPAPELSKAVGDLSIEEVYWIVANGIKDTGMPAFKAALKDEDLWMIASFVGRMSGMSAKDYESLGQSEK